MIKIIIERHVKEAESLWPMLWELRTAARYQPGYITGETLVGSEDKSLVAVISTWHSLEDWKAWETSETRAKLCHKIEPLLVEKPKVRTYDIASTELRQC